MAYEMTQHRRLSEISRLDARLRGRFHKLPSETRREIVERLETVTRETLVAEIEKTKKSATNNTNGHQ